MNLIRDNEFHYSLVLIKPFFHFALCSLTDISTDYIVRSLLKYLQRALLPVCTSLYWFVPVYTYTPDGSRNMKHCFALTDMY